MRAVTDCPCVAHERRRKKSSRDVIPSVHTVLVPTDFSEVANSVIPNAYAVVDDGGTVHLLHVVEVIEPLVQPNPLYAHYVPGHSPTPEARERQHAELTARLRALIPAGADARGIRTEVHVIEGEETAEAVNNMAEQWGVSLLCLGSKGHFGLTEVILGSVARAILAHSRRPVLVVPAIRTRD